MSAGNAKGAINAPAHWIDYYKLQYERIQHLESQRVQVSGFVVAGSLASFSILLKSGNSVSTVNLLGAAFTLFMANLICILFVRKSRMWVKFHQSRAHVILRSYQPDLLEVVKKHGPVKPDSNSDLFNRTNLQAFLHLIFLLSAMLLPALVNFENGKDSYASIGAKPKEALESTGKVRFEGEHCVCLLPVD